MKTENKSPREGRITKVPLGIELQPASIDLALKLFSQGLIDHVQISAPSGWSPALLDRLPDGLPLCVHSLFLNVLGDNDWTLLATAAKRIKRLKPLAVVEHFGTSIDAKGAKHAVSFDPSPSKASAQIRLAVSNLKRWKRLLGCPVMLENIPVDRGVQGYFYAYQRVAQAAGTPCSLDLPHLIVSFNASGFSYQSTLDAVARLNPEHVHIGGVQISSDRIEDNHKLISPWLLRVLESARIRPRMITLEQSDQLPSSYVEKNVRLIQHGLWGAVPDLDARRKTRTGAEFSDFLASGRAAAWGVATARRRRPAAGKPFQSRLLGVAESHYSYVYPFASMKQASGEMAVDDAVESLAMILQLSRDFGSWYFDGAGEKVYIRVSRGGASRILDFDGEIEIDQIPKKSHKEYTIRTRDKSEVTVFTVNAQREKTHEDVKVA